MLSVPSEGTYYYVPVSASSTDAFYVFAADIDYNMTIPPTTTTTTTTRETTTETTTQSIVYVKDAMANVTDVSDRYALRSYMTLVGGGTMGSGSAVFNRGMESEQVFEAGTQNKIMLTPADGAFVSADAVKGNTVSRAAFVENILEITAKYKGKIIVYAAAEGKSVALIDENRKIVDTGVITADSSGAFNVPELIVPAAGTYKVLISDRTSGVDLYAVDFKHNRYRNVIASATSVVMADIEKVKADGYFVGDEVISDNISIVLLQGLSSFGAKSVSATFNDGEKTYSNENGMNALQIGNGNLKIAAEDVVVGFSPTEDVEKGFRIKVDGPSDITVYGALATSGKESAKFALIKDDANYRVVDVAEATRPNGEGTFYYVPTLHVDEAGSYIFFIPGKVSGLNVLEVDIIPTTESNSSMDVDGDGLITDDDAKALLKRLSGITSGKIYGGDADKNNTVNILDVIAIEKMLEGR